MNPFQAPTIPLARLNEAMPTGLKPIESLHERLGDESFALAWTRISAFSRFATSVDDLVEWIDNAPEDTREGYRTRFRLLLASLARVEKCYAYRRRSGPRDSGFVLDAASAPKLGPALTEDDEADILIPGRRLALLGHDDFGCTLVYQQLADRQWLEQLAQEAGLYSVRPPET